MTAPFFTVAIPTKNRPDRLLDAVKSVIGQSFPDFQLIVCDNSDDAETAQLAASAVRQLDDPRVCYIRTNGRLSMADNWERAIADARGEYVGILTDRCVFREDTLAVVHAEIQNTPAHVVKWYQASYGRDAAGKHFQPRRCTCRRYRFDRTELLNYVFRGDPKYALKVIPRLMTSMCHRKTLDAIRASAVGRCCPPVCPDYTSGFLILAFSDSVLLIDEGLEVSCGNGNGWAFRLREAPAERFRQDLGMSWQDMVDHMPTAACFSHAVVLNDFARLQEMLPERLSAFAIDRARYYEGCMLDYLKAARRGADRNADFDVLVEGLRSENDELQQRLQSSRLYRKSLRARLDAGDEIGASRDPDLAIGKSESANQFDTVFEALAWERETSPTPIARGFLDDVSGGC